MLVNYPACFYKESDGQYSVLIPDIRSSTCGASLEEAMSMAIDLLAGWLYSTRQDGESVPKATAIAKLDPAPVYEDMTGDALPEDAEAFTTLVTVDVDEYAKKHFNKAVKKTLTVPAWLNDRAVSAGINFSATLQAALKEQLGISDR